MHIVTPSERRQRFAGPALFSHGFRPFFLFGALFAGGAIPLWLAMFIAGLELPGAFQGMAWHTHEMIFGYLAGIVAGFILTAVPNWTGRLPVMGAPLALLFVLWLTGRATVAFVPSPWVALIGDCAFTVFLAGFIWREVLAGKNWRNTPICLLVSLFAIANILFHLAQQYGALSGYGERLALGVTATLIGLVGGRITPSFTRNWMARLNLEPLPASFGRFDKIVLLCATTAMASWIVLPEAPMTGILLVCAGLLHFTRLIRWRGEQTFREPIVTILHIGYGWLVIAFVLMGLAILVPAIVDGSSALHALTAGAIGTMTLAVMTRASLGHTGRAIQTGPATLGIYLLVTGGATLRVSAAYLPLDYQSALTAGGALWACAFLLFGISYAPLLLSRPQ